MGKQDEVEKQLEMFRLEESLREMDRQIDLERVEQEAERRHQEYLTAVRSNADGSISSSASSSPSSDGTFAFGLAVLGLLILPWLTNRLFIDWWAGRLLFRPLPTLLSISIFVGCLVFIKKWRRMRNAQKTQALLSYFALAFPVEAIITLLNTRFGMHIHIGGSWICFLVGICVVVWSGIKSLIL